MDKIKNRDATEWITDKTTVRVGYFNTLNSVTDRNK